MAVGERVFETRTPFGTFTRRSTMDYTHIIVGVKPGAAQADPKDVVYTSGDELFNKYVHMLAKRGLEVHIYPVTLSPRQKRWVVKSVYPEGPGICYAEVIPIGPKLPVPDHRRLSDGTDIYYDIYYSAQAAAEAAREVNKCYA